MDYLSRVGQANAVLELALRRQQLSAARLYAALADVASTPSGQIVLADLVQTVLLRGMPNLEDLVALPGGVAKDVLQTEILLREGERRVVLKLLAGMAEALEKRHLSEEEHYHERFDGWPSAGAEAGNPAAAWARGDDSDPADSAGRGAGGGAGGP